MSCGLPVYAKRHRDITCIMMTVSALPDRGYIASFGTPKTCFRIPYQEEICISKTRTIGRLDRIAIRVQLEEHPPQQVSSNAFDQYHCSKVRSTGN